MNNIKYINNLGVFGVKKCSNLIIVSTSIIILFLMFIMFDLIFNKGETPSIVYYIAIMINFMCLITMIFYIDGQERRRANLAIKKQNIIKQLGILKSFNNGEEIFIRVKRGFMMVSFVISKGNNWKYENKKFVCGNEFFTLKEVNLYMFKI
jgi:hypothetical protein